MTRQMIPVIIMAMSTITFFESWTGILVYLTRDARRLSATTGQCLVFR